MACSVNYLKKISWKNYHNHYLEFDGIMCFKFENTPTPMTTSEVENEVRSHNCDWRKLSRLSYFRNFPEELSASVIGKKTKSCGGLLVDIRNSDFVVVLENQRKMVISFTLIDNNRPPLIDSEISVYDISNGDPELKCVWKNKEPEKTFTITTDYFEKTYLFKCPNLKGHLGICDEDNYYLGFDDGPTVDGFDLGDSDFNDAALIIHIENNN